MNTSTKINETFDDINFLKLFNAMREKFGDLKGFHSLFRKNQERLKTIYTNNTLTKDIVRKYKFSDRFFKTFIVIDGGLAIPSIAFVLVYICRLPSDSTFLRPLSIAFSPIASAGIMYFSRWLVNQYLSYNLERLMRKKALLPFIGCFSLLALIPLTTMIVWVSSSHANILRVVFDIAVPIIIFVGACYAVYYSALFRIKYHNIEETVKEYEEAEDLEDRRDEITGLSRGLKKEVETLASRFLPYIQNDSVSQINKRFATLPIDERYILIEKIYRWTDDEFFAGKDDVMIRNYFGDEVANSDFVKFWNEL